MSKKIKYLAVSLWVFFIFLVGVFIFSYSPPETEPPTLAAKKSYLQWSIYLFAGNPKACNLMTKDAQRAYVLASPFPTAACPEVAQRTRAYLDRKELFEPYAVSETFQKNIRKIKVEGDRVLIFTLDFKNGRDPIIFENKDGQWLVSGDSFASKKSPDVTWISGRPD